MHLNTQITVRKIRTNPKIEYQRGFGGEVEDYKPLVCEFKQNIFPEEAPDCNLKDALFRSVSRTHMQINTSWHYTENHESEN